MTRTILFSFAAIGVGPAALLALGTLAVNLVSVLFRPISLSFRVYYPGRPNEYLDFIPAQLSSTTALVILVGSALVLNGIARIQPEETRRSTQPPSSSTQ